MKVGKQNLNYPKYQSLVHDNAVKKGFWENVNFHSLVADITVEVGELISAIKSGRASDIIGYEKDLLNEVCYLIPGRHENDRFKQDRKIFELRIKDTDGDEIADVAILTMSLCEGFGLKIDKSCFPNSDMVLNFAKSDNNVFMMINRLSFLVSKVAGTPIDNFGTSPMVQTLICQILYSVEFIAEYLQIDLEYHIDKKMRYNQDRPYLHGKKQIMSAKSCEFLDCGFCFDKSNNNNSSKNGSCSAPWKCQILNAF